MKAAENCVGENTMAFGDPMAIRRWCAPLVGRIRNTWPEALVRTSAVIVFNPLLKDPSQMTLVQGNHPVKALTPDRADHTLAERVRLR